MFSCRCYAHSIYNYFSTGAYICTTEGKTVRIEKPLSASGLINNVHDISFRGSTLFLSLSLSVYIHIFAYTYTYIIYSSTFSI